MPRIGMGILLKKYKGKKQVLQFVLNIMVNILILEMLQKKLDEIALQLGILFKKTMNTQEKGKRLIQKLKELGQKA